LAICRGPAAAARRFPFERKFPAGGRGNAAFADCGLGRFGLLLPFPKAAAGQGPRGISLSTGFSYNNVGLLR